jgi:predicted RNA binding protein YcfA (HicA-like mRNA interferase family)
VSAIPDRDPVDLTALLGRLRHCGWVLMRSSTKHVLYEEPLTNRVVVVPQGFELIAPGVYQITGSATPPEQPVRRFAHEAFDRLAEVGSRNTAPEDPVAAVRAERDAR